MHLRRGGNARHGFAQRAGVEVLPARRNAHDDRFEIILRHCASRHGVDRCALIGSICPSHQRAGG
jgi:hypothetical protein